VIVVVDAKTTDATAALAAVKGAKVFVEQWKGFGPLKQYAIDQCRNNWILIVDADEYIPEETVMIIKEIVNRSRAAAGYSFPRKNYFQDRWIKHAGWWPDRVVRLFQKGRGCMSGARVHESLEIDGPVGKLQAPIEHYTEGRLSKVLLKIDQYSTLGAEEAYASGKACSVWSAGARALATFIRDYFLKLGILDGRQGFILATTDSINKFFKYAKLDELNRSGSRQKDRRE
jgi:glycosyltransferase involved in cell wall biosynthesis